MDDIFSHPQMENRLRIEAASSRVEREAELDRMLSGHERRLSRLERFQWLLTGVGLAISAALSAGALTLLLHR